MTQKEMTRLRVINQTIDKVITIREAAELLNLSERQVIRLMPLDFVSIPSSI